MAPASIPAGVLHKPTLLLLLLLLPELLWAARTEQWCSIQGDIDQKPIFSYDCSSAIPKATNIMGEEVNSTETWEHIRETSKHVGEQLREKLLDTKPQNCGTTAPLTLSANMTCQLVAGGHRSWCWDFDINGKTSAQVDSRRKMWTEEPSGRSCMKDNWEKDKEMTSILYRTSEGDCQKWREELLKHLKRQEEPTAPPPTTQNLPPSSSVVITPNVWVLLLIITCSILCCFYGEIQ
ncbi:NKG2D ligand 1 [Fukomys damarensis]|uniref:NKG2D ligand 1 n=1 Tax=Fukomys damarensis TaxID=885580 RepID=A0A091DH26_FUKDA|nr:NKG2D ligand 1 [Fukomys damarensis]